MPQDLRYAIRQLRKSPGLALVVILTLAVGIGALTTVMTWANAISFNPWPAVRDARQLRFVSAQVQAGSGYSQHYDHYEYLRQHAQGFSDLTAHELMPVDLAGNGATPERYWSGFVASNYFEMLGVQPVVGRGLRPHDDRAYGSAPEVVIGYALWHSRFHGDPAILGKTIEVNRHPLTVVGIAPQDFVGIYGGLVESLWVPLSEIPDLTGGNPDPLIAGNFGLQIAVRLRPGVSDSEAAAELHTLAGQYAQQQHTTYYQQWDLLLNDSAHMSRGFYGELGEQMPFQAGAAVLLLVLICANIAGLLIQRSARRAREMAIRTALGATAARLVRQLLVETTVLTAMAAVAGWLFSIVLARALYLLMPKLGIAFVFNLQTDWRILLFVVGITGVVVIACGVLPARQVLRLSQIESLHAGSVSVVGSRRGLRNVLVSVQLAICFVLVIACGLLLRTLWNVVHRDPGFDTQNALVASLDLRRAGYTEEKGLAFQRALFERLRNAPGVENAILTSYVPMGATGGGHVRDVAIEGYQPAKGESMSIVTDSVGPEFFRTMRIAVIAGREFTDQDGPSAACVAIVNESMVQKYWPKGNALDGQIGVSNKNCRVVGVVRNIIYRSAAWETGDPVLYLAMLQDYQGWFSLVLRSRTSAYTALPALQSAVATLDSSLPITDVESLNEHIQVSYAGQKIPAEMIGVYGACCLLVAMLGVYAVMAYSVAERSREFALRMALGAGRSRVLRLVLGSGLRVVVLGLVLGAVLSLFAVRLLKSLLYGVSPFDPASAAFAVLLVSVTALAAALFPARRAASIEPMDALRME